MRRLYCIWAVLAVVVPGPADAGRHELARQPQAAPDTTGYTIFLRGAPIGREDVTVQIGAEGTTVTSQGRLSAPFNAITRLAEFRYGPDWSPQLFVLDGTSNGAPVTIKTTFVDGKATSQGVQGSMPINVTHAVTAGTIVLPNGIFSGYAALALRLASVNAGEELRAYILPQGEIGIRVAAVNDEQMQLGNAILKVRRYDLVFENPGSGDLPVTMTAADTGRLIRVNVAAQGLDIVRDDVAASTSRMRVHANPGDEPVTIPAAGFNLGATLTRPTSGPAVLPAVILLSGPTVPDRDGFALGVPVFGQLASALADAGFLVVRYDKRGNGQSGGRSESATIRDYAEDARSVFNWLEDRSDVDSDRISLVGHGEGAWVALLTAAREKDVAAVVSIAGASTPGTELNLQQQRLALDRSTLTDADRQARIALQKQIQSAVLSGTGWEAVPPELRRQADTPWFKSFLEFEPAEVIEDVRAPLLFVHPALDREVPVAHVEGLAELAKTESDSEAIEVVVVRGVNHLLVPATTGEVAEYATLTDRNVSADVTGAVTSWLTKTLAAIR